MRFILGVKASPFEIIGLSTVFLSTFY